MYRRPPKKSPYGNPVAKAIIKQELTSQILDHKIMQAGEPCDALMEATGVSMAMVGYAAELEAAKPGSKFSREDPKLRILRGGLSACQQMLLANRWDPLQATSIAMGIDATVELVPLVSPESLAEAMRALS
jgi:hypothetical protein